MQVPFDRLSREALLGVVDDFILREGTDYGLEETEHDDKRAQVIALLERGEVLVVFDPETETTSIAPRAEVADG